MPAVKSLDRCRGIEAEGEALLGRAVDLGVEDFSDPGKSLPTDLPALVGEFPRVALAGEVKVCLLHGSMMQRGCDKVRFPSSTDSLRAPARCSPRSGLDSCDQVVKKRSSAFDDPTVAELRATDRLMMVRSVRA